ncbi:hypothetical protein SDC9_153183 [bioreactor metagenome]|uniref:Uncharacterized protein n=1 Tax=bioreactor metagenome TaxID=1076179 RepID=A0A645EXN3_9ZZZZ
MRLRIRPPTSAPNSAASQMPTGTAEMEEGEDGAAPSLLPPNCALALSAASSAGDTVAGAAVAGQPPSTGSSARQPCPSLASTTGMGEGLSLRCCDSGTRAVHTSPSHCWLISPAVWITDSVSGKKDSVRPLSSPGRPAPRTLIASPSTLTEPLALASADRLRGWAFSASAKAAEFSAVVPWIGTCSVNVPSSGMHSLRHTSQVACNWKVASLASGPGLKVLATVIGTGSSTVFS